MLTKLIQYLEGNTPNAKDFLRSFPIFNVTTASISVVAAILLVYIAGHMICYHSMKFATDRILPDLKKRYSDNGYVTHFRDNFLSLQFAFIFLHLFQEVFFIPYLFLCALFVKPSEYFRGVCFVASCMAGAALSVILCVTIAIRMFQV
jgi:hypothetical protein